MDINGVERPDFVPNPAYAHHDYSAGTYTYFNEVMCSTCGRPPGAVVHDSGPNSTPGTVSADSAADATTDDVTDKQSLVHAQNALRELVLALNNEPDSWNIANAILYVQDAVDCMRLEVKYPLPDDDELETPALSTAAAQTVADAKSKVTTGFVRKWLGA